MSSLTWSSPINSLWPERIIFPNSSLTWFSLRTKPPLIFTRLAHFPLLIMENGNMSARKITVPYILCNNCSVRKGKRSFRQKGLVTYFDDKAKYSNLTKIGRKKIDLSQNQIVTLVLSELTVLLSQFVPFASTTLLRRSYFYVRVSIDHQ